MSFTILDYLLWIAINVCNGILLILLRKGPARPRIAIFTSYVVFKMTQSIILVCAVELVIHHLLGFAWYARTYDVLLIPEYFLQLGILYQLYYRLLKPHKVLPERAFYVFLAGCGLILLVCAIIALQQPANLSTHIASIFTDFSRSINLMQCAGYFFVVAFASSLGLSIRHSIVGVALGMGISRMGDLVLAALIAQWGVLIYHYVRYLPDLTYLCSTLIWIVYFRRDQTSRVDLHPSMLAALQKFQQQVDRVFPRHRSNSSL